jgi:hypothetical protein
MRRASDAELKEEQRELEKLRSRVYAAKTAYLNRTPFGDKTEISYEDLKAIAEEFIQASYEYQKKRYGSVRVRISVAKLLRR